MISNILMYVLFFAGFTVISGLFLAVFISAFFRSKVKSIVLLIVFGLLSFYNIRVGFNFSEAMGIGMITILVILSVLAIVMIVRRLKAEKAV